MIGNEGAVVIAERCCSVTQSCLTLCNPMDCRTPGFPLFHISQSLLKLMTIELVMPSNHLILCCSLLPLPSIFPSIRVFSNESVLRIRWPKYWSFSISPSNEYSGLISFRWEMPTLNRLRWETDVCRIRRGHWIEVFQEEEAGSTEAKKWGI